MCTSFENVIITTCTTPNEERIMVSFNDFLKSISLMYIFKKLGAMRIARANIHRFNPVDTRIARITYITG